MSTNAQCSGGACIYPKSQLNGTPCQLDSGVSGSCSAGVCTSGSPTVCGGTQGGFEFKCQTAGCLPGQSKAPELTCSANNFCCGTALTPSPTSTPVPTATPVPTPVPGATLLALALTQQGLTSAPVNLSRSATVVLQGQGTDDQIITKTGSVRFSNGTFNGTVNLGVLPAGTFKLKVKVGNFLRSPIINLAISGTAASVQTTIVTGLTNQLTDQFTDNVDAISFYANGLKDCFGATLGVIKCNKPEDVDLNGDTKVDVIDYQIYLKGIRNLIQGLPVQ